MRVVIFGHGSIGSRHARALWGWGVQVVVVDPEPASAVGPIPWFPLPEQLSGHFDGALICTPSTVRNVLLDVCKNHGVKHVFVEKPLAATLAEAQVIIGRPAGPHICGVGNNLRYSIVPKLRQVGQPTAGAIHFDHDIDQWREGRDPSETPTLRPGGGILREAGAHELDMAMLLFGKLGVASSVIERVDGIDRTVDALLFNEAGTPVTLHLGMSAAEYERRVVVWANGERYEIRLAKEPIAETYVTEMASWVAHLATQLPMKSAASPREAAAVLALIEAIENVGWRGEASHGEAGQGAVRLGSP